jgi:hypothetical protein
MSGRCGVIAAEGKFEIAGTPRVASSKKLFIIRVFREWWSVSCGERPEFR